MPTGDVGVAFDVNDHHSVCWRCGDLGHAVVDLRRTLGCMCDCMPIAVAAQWVGEMLTTMQVAGPGLFIVSHVPSAATAPALPAPAKPAPSLFAVVVCGPVIPPGAPLPAPIVLAAIVAPGANHFDRTHCQNPGSHTGPTWGPTWPRCPT